MRLKGKIVKVDFYWPHSNILKRYKKNNLAYSITGKVLEIARGRYSGGKNTITIQDIKTGEIYNGGYNNHFIIKGELKK